MHVQTVFAVPGDLSAATGGYHYDRRLLAALNEAGHATRHIALSGTFPFPDATVMRETLDVLCDLPRDCVAIVDGLAFGALDTDGLDRVAAPIVALVHHPLAHESGLPKPEAQRLFHLERANLGKAAHILVTGEYTRDVLTADYDVAPDKISIIRPGKPEFQAATPEKAKAEPPLILSVGLLHPRKGHDVLIEALAACAYLDWRAVIVGTPWEDGYDATLRRLLEAEGLAHRVELAGRVSTERLALLYGQARVFALATRYEGYGIVFDEALIHGLPIVSTTAGAVPRTVPQDAGQLVPPDDAPAFAAALRPILLDAGLHRRMSNAATAAGRALPSWADAADIVGDILTRVRERGA